MDTARTPRGHGSTSSMTRRAFHGRVARKILMQYSNPELRSLTMFAGYWHDAARRELLPDGPSELLRNWRRRWLEDAFAHADNPIDRMLWLDNHTYLPGCLLVKMDIASMHCGLETRSPLLDHEVIEFCARLSAAVQGQGSGRQISVEEAGGALFSQPTSSIGPRWGLAYQWPPGCADRCARYCAKRCWTPT